MSTLEEREAEIRARISLATALENEHGPGRAGWCVCHRPYPCNVVVRAREARDAASRDLKEVHELPNAQTIVLPVIRDEVPPPRRPRADHRLPRRLVHLGVLVGLRRP